MDRCYINLSIVQGQDTTDPRRPDNITQYLPSWLPSRLQVGGPVKQNEIMLQKIFDTREGVDGIVGQPSRILIRGKAGMGKTTLCQKIIHDFKRGDLWPGVFERVLWMPLTSFT